MTNHAGRKNLECRIASAARNESPPIMSLRNSSFGFRHSFVIRASSFVIWTMIQMIFQHKTVVITGGGSGIGRATALALARAGAQVVIGNRNREQGQAVVQEIAALGGHAEFVRTDVSNVNDVKALVAHAVAKFGRLHLAFNNAGMEGESKPLHEQDESLANQLLDVNLKGVFWAMQYE